MGGRVGYELAVTPEYAKFFNAFIINGMGGAEVDIILEFAKWAAVGGMPSVVKQMEATFMMEAFPAAIRETFLNNDPKAYYAANSKAWPAVLDRLSLIDKPVLMICGEKADECAEMKKAAILIKQSELKIIPGLDHAQAYWYASQVVPLILEFVSSVLQGNGEKL